MLVRSVRPIPDVQSCCHIFWRVATELHKVELASGTKKCSEEYHIKCDPAPGSSADALNAAVVARRWAQRGLRFNPWFVHRRSRCEPSLRRKHLPTPATMKLHGCSPSEASFFAACFVFVLVLFHPSTDPVYLLKP